MILTDTECITCSFIRPQYCLIHFGFQLLIIAHYHMEFKTTCIYIIILLESTQHDKKANKYSKYTY